MTADGATPAGYNESIRRMIREELARLMYSGSSRNMSIGEGGRLTIKGGELRVLYPEDEGGGVGVYFGDIRATVSGDYQGTGLHVQDADGVDIATFRSDAASGRPIAIIRDSTGYPIMWSDTASGFGFGQPWFGAALYPARTSDWPSTTSTSFETLFKAQLPKQNAKVQVRVWGINTDAGATGQLQVLVNNVPLGAAQDTVSGIVTERLFYGDVAGNFGDVLAVEVQARRVTGTGAVQVGGHQALGRN